VQGIHWAQKVKADPFRKALLYALGERHNIDTGLCMPDQEMLARDAGMSSRTVRKYAKILNDEGFIERRVTSAGRGVTTHYVLNFDVLEAQNTAPNRKQASERSAAQLSGRPTGTPVPDPNRNPRSGPTGSCVPDDKKHEYTKKNTNLLSDETSDERSPSKKKTKSNPKPIDDTETLEVFAKLWDVWPRKGRERSRSKATVLDQLRRAAKLKPLSAILDAARKFAGQTEAQFCPGLDRWLQQGRYEHFLPPDLAAKVVGGSVPKPSSDGIDWPEMIARWWRADIWPNRLGERPDDWGYSGPIEPVEALIDQVLATGRTHGDRLARLKRNIDDVKARRLATGKATR
jgi:hypothetical protein